nr:MAG TPA: protein of unknown function (DUF1998) [Caudoviricetes sp.]
MRFEVETEHKGGLNTDHVFNDWNDCRNFLLVLTDNNGILIRDIAESLLQSNVYVHRNKWYTLKVTCENEVSIGEAIKVLGNYECNCKEGCNNCPFSMDIHDIFICIPLFARQLEYKLQSEKTRNE